MFPRLAHGRSTQAKRTENGLGARQGSDLVSGGDVAMGAGVQLSARPQPDTDLCQLSACLSTQGRGPGTVIHRGSGEPREDGPSSSAQDFERARTPASSPHHPCGLLHWFSFLE